MNIQKEMYGPFQRQDSAKPTNPSKRSPLPI